MERNPPCHVIKILNYSTKPTSCGLLAVSGPALPLVTLPIELIANHIRLMKIFHAGLPEGHG